MFKRYYFFFFFNDTATTEIYTLSLHDALPILWFLLPRVARLMIHTPTAISIFVCLSMVQLMAHKNTDSSRRDRKSGSAGMPRPISYAVFCLKKKKNGNRHDWVGLPISPDIQRFLTAS